MKDVIKKITKSVFKYLLILTLMFNILSLPAYAVKKSPLVDDVSNAFFDKAGLNPTGLTDSNQATIATRIGKIIDTLLQFVGIIILVIVIYAGFLWLTAGGNEEQVIKAKKWLANAVIGSLVIGLAYAITAFVLYLTQ